MSEPVRTCTEVSSAVTRAAGSVNASRIRAAASRGGYGLCHVSATVILGRSGSELDALGTQQNRQYTANPPRRNTMASTSTGVVMIPRSRSSVRIAFATNIVTKTTMKSTAVERGRRRSVAATGAHFRRGAGPWVRDSGGRVSLTGSHATAARSMSAPEIPKAQPKPAASASAPASTGPAIWPASAHI